MNKCQVTTFYETCVFEEYHFNEELSQYLKQVYIEMDYESQQNLFFEEKFKCQTCSNDQNFRNFEFNTVSQECSTQQRQTNNSPKGNQNQKLQQKTSKKRIIKEKNILNACCNCKTSQCLKRYCPCFHRDGFCGPQCKCKGCLNNNESISKVENARQHVFQKCHRNKNCSRKELLTNDKTFGCKCQKRNCISGYCECHKRGQKCDDKCNCQDCKNIIEEQCNNPIEMYLNNDESIKESEFYDFYSH